MNNQGKAHIEMEKWFRIKETVRASITQHLEEAQLDDLIRKKALSETGVFSNLCKWMEDRFVDILSPQAKAGILDAIAAKRWGDLSEVFYTDIEFGTGGIRGRAVIGDDELELLRDEGIYARFLRGPNTVNDIVFAQISAAIAGFGQDRGYNSIVVGYDSRIRGKDFAHLIASVFLAYGFKVFLFEDVVPYPEVTFAIPHIGADMGILISASHNDRRYNGYKLSCANGSQFSIEDRSIILGQYIGKTGFDKIRRVPLESANEGDLVFLGGGYRYPHLNYYNYSGDPLDVHSQHFRHVLDFLMDRPGIRRIADTIHVAYSAYNGAGGPTLKRLVEALGIIKFDVIASLYKVDGMFPAFGDLRSPKGYKVYQQPDPGEPRAAEIAVGEYVKEYGSERLKRVDVVLGTDPDADRAGITVQVPRELREVYGGSEYVLLDADTAWSLIMWHRMENWTSIPAAKRLGLALDDCFLVQSHTTTDVLPLLATKYGLGWVKTWVGFAQLATGVEKVWNKTLRETFFSTPYATTDFRSIHSYEGITSRTVYNFAALEQSNGFSILGARPTTASDLGEFGHVRDKDGTFAAVLFFDVLAYAKSAGKSILELADEKLYLDPDIGLIRTGYRAAPQYGQYEGLEGRSLKMDILRRTVELMDNIGGGLKIASRKITRAEVYRTGKYDIQHGHTAETGFNPDRRETYLFPDEGVRFFFEDAFNHLTIRPSGTSQSLRFHIQLRNTGVSTASLKADRINIEKEIQHMFEDIGKRIGVDWEV